MQLRTEHYYLPTLQALFMPVLKLKVYMRNGGWTARAERMPSLS